MKPELINAGLYLYRGHYIKKRRDCRAWDVFAQETGSEGIILYRVKSRADTMRQIDSFYQNRKKVMGLF